MEILVLVATVGLITYLVFAQNASASDTLEDIGGNVDTSANSVTVKIAQAIASAEGFGVPNARPTRNHNPGDMTADLIGRAISKDGNFVVYANDEDGWLNLYAQVNAWLNSTSKHAGPDSTISQVSSFYTTTEQDIWANTVANHLGVDVSTPIGEIA